ncbi:hypothetical protein GOODEAATRI_001021 [Goodea atripinnis]|uniref:Uncharacterized protein n=1 Tax=Goodea atripinnis TaxID=208336 RepID=A0ABV0NGI8_9TELE
MLQRNHMLSAGWILNYSGQNFKCSFNIDNKCLVDSDQALPAADFEHRPPALCCFHRASGLVHFFRTENLTMSLSNILLGIVAQFFFHLSINAFSRGSLAYT